MKKSKAAIALATITAAFLLLLVTAALIVPPLLDKTLLGNKVRQKISSKVGGEFNFESISFAVFPSPHAVLIKPQLSIPEKFSASAETIQLYPDLLRSFFGNNSVKKLALDRPKATIWMSASSEGPEKNRKQFDGSKILPALMKSFSRLSDTISSIDLGTLSHGSIELVYNQAATVTLKNLDASIENVSGSIAIKATAASDIFKNLTVTGTIHPRQFEGGTHIGISAIDLGAVSAIFSPHSSLRIESGSTDLDLSFALQDKHHINLDFNASAPHVRMADKGRTADIEALTLAGMATLSPASATVTVSDFQLGNPAMRVSGSAAISEENPEFILKLQGRGIDVRATRAAALVLAGSNPAVKTVFNILRDGTIPSLAVSGQADVPQGLTDLDNLVLQASLINGKIYIPGANIELTDATGEVGLSKRVLTGENVAAQLHHSKLQHGEFKIDLAKDPLPLSVGTDIDIDVADLPKILKKFIHDKTFNDELAHIDDLGGSAAGTLALSGDVDRIQIGASATDINISARYRDIPYPLKITDGEISYEKNQIQVKRATGSLGTSTFNSLSGTIGLSETKTFTITSGASRIVLKDMMPWLSSYKATRKITTYYGGGDGILESTKIQAEGSLHDLRHAHFSLAGDIHDLTIQNLPRQPGPLAISSMKYSGDPKTVVFSDVQARMLDGSVNISGKYPDYLTKNPKISLSFDGRMGPQIISWITDNAHLPPWLELRPLSIRKSHLTYSNQGQAKISAALALQDDLEVIAELGLAADTVMVDSLKVKDHLSEATVTAKKEGRQLDVSFDGALHNSSLNQIVGIKSLQSGSINGKAKVSLNLENPVDFSFLGEVSGKQIAIPITAEIPLIVNSISVTGTPGNIDITSADLSWNGTALKVSGSMRPGAEALPRLNLNVEADGIDVDTIMKQTSSLGKTQRKKPDPVPLLSSLEGDVRLKVNTLKVHGYTVEPLQADIRLHDKAAEVTLKELILCGIPVTGTATLSRQNIVFHLEPEAHTQKLSSTLKCLDGRKFKADGTLDFSGVFDGHGTMQELARSTAGNMEISISDGHIYHDIIMLNLLKFLNTSQVLTGKVTADKMLEKGLGFARLQARVKIENAKLLYENLILDGEEIKLWGTGEIDILKRHIDFTLLVAPLKTSSALLKHVPLIGGVLQTVETIPLGVKGTFEDLHFLPLAPSAVEDELQDVMKQTLGIPFKLVHLDAFRKNATHGER